ALAKLWEVDESLLLDLLAMEEKLTIVDRTVQLLIEDYDSSFGGTHLDVKDKKVYVNTVGLTITRILYHLYQQTFPWLP
ncbi:44251_t:CDS:1, partial [Gigaspora margarita]